MGSSSEIRLVCKLPAGVQGTGRLAGALERAGYVIEHNSIMKGSFRAELRAASLQGDEAVILVKGLELDGLKEFLSLLARECWYIDVYYHLRGEAAQAAMRRLGVKISDESAHRIRLRISGVDLRVDAYPRSGALAISYRMGWREVNSGAALKIHKMILGEAGRRGVLGRLLGWVR